MDSIAACVHFGKYHESRDVGRAGNNAHLLRLLSRCTLYVHLSLVKTNIENLLLDVLVLFSSLSQGISDKQ